MTTSIPECCVQSPSSQTTLNSSYKPTLLTQERYSRYTLFRTQPSNWDWRSPIPPTQNAPSAGYSITERHWEISKKYERIVEQLAGMPYSSFCREYWLNDRLVLNTQDDHWDAENKVVVSSLYRHKVYAYIVTKAHDILWGLASSPNLTDEDWYRIHEHSDEQTVT